MRKVCKYEKIRKDRDYSEIAEYVVNTAKNECEGITFLGKKLYKSNRIKLEDYHVKNRMQTNNNSVLDELLKEHGNAYFDFTVYRSSEDKYIIIQSITQFNEKNEIGYKYGHLYEIEDKTKKDYI